jgi:hypothetical protein
MGAFDPAYRDHPHPFEGDLVFPHTFIVYGAAHRPHYCLGGTVIHEI